VSDTEGANLVVEAHAVEDVAQVDRRGGLAVIRRACARQVTFGGSWGGGGRAQKLRWGGIWCTAPEPASASFRPYSMSMVGPPHTLIASALAIWITSAHDTAGYFSLKALRYTMHFARPAFAPAPAVRVRSAQAKQSKATARLTVAQLVLEADAPVGAALARRRVERAAVVPCEAHTDRGTVLAVDEGAELALELGQL
jgi:hypothetical protein